MIDFNTLRVLPGQYFERRSILVEYEDTLFLAGKILLFLVLLIAMQS